MCIIDVKFSFVDEKEKKEKITFFSKNTNKPLNDYLFSPFRYG